ncbi:MAG: alpha/beta hydrolase [Gammaproteobacteria bacterium]|nr:alpha/beta hydrolase [Pseudomonadales bacterium]MCP5347841.1 alpha/beta hydrolase [Pseudomonadales bacterium]
MSFNLEQARQLRDQLPVMDFRTPVSDDPLTSAYLSHYGLNRLHSPWPISHSLGYCPGHPGRVACHYFMVPEPACVGQFVIVHGYYDHVGLFRHPIEFCLSRGYSVLAFDLPGHGLSDGDPASIGSFDDYSRALLNCLTGAEQSGIEGPWQVLAQSTGAAALINCFLKPAEFPLGNLQNIILLAPLLRPVDWTSGLIKFWLLRWFVRRVGRDFARNSHDEEFLRFIAEDDPLQARYLMVDWVRSLKQYLNDFAAAPEISVPLSIIQGTEDTTVDWRYNLPHLRSGFPNTETYLIEGARHHLANESAEFRAQLFTIVAGILDS